MATPKLALIPTGYKAGKLYSVLPESGVGDFTVVRATEATRVNEEGLIETMGANVPRLDYSGGGCPVLLTEPQRTNLVPYSEDFSQNSSWNKVGASVTSGFVSPDGTLNAFKMTETTSTGGHYASTSNIGVTLGDDTTFSVFIKKGESNFIQLLFSGASHSSTNYANFDLLNGVLGSVGAGVAKIESIGGFYRCSFTSQATSTTATKGYIWKIQSLTSSRAESYTGDGTSGVYIYGAQLEANASYPTSYIPTEGSAVTRNGDQVYGSGDASTFNNSEGVLMAEISALADDADTLRWINLNDGGTSNRVAFYYRTDVNQLTYLVSSGSTQVFSTVTLSSASSFNKIAAKYKQNDFSLWINGYELITDTSGNAPVGLNELSFDNAVGGDNFYGKTSQIQYYNTALTDIELETLTSWTSFIEMAQAQNYNII